MGEDQLKYVSGEFEGYFYTHQKMPMGELEKLPGGNTHQVYIYRGELKNYSLLDDYKPEEHINREGLLLHNVTNIQLSNSSGSEKRIYDFDQLVLKNVQVPQSWELDGKTYGIIQGSLVGKIKKQANPSIGNSPENIPPPPTIPPKEPEKKWWKTVPPIVGGTNPTPPIGGSNRRGCLSWLWDLLKWILLLLLLLLLYKACTKNDGSNLCCIENQEKIRENDSLLKKIDSLENKIKIDDSLRNKIEEEDKIQEEINDVSEQIFFYGNSDKIRKYSENSIKELIGILNRNPNLNLEIQGHTNGSNPNYKGLDIRRAEKVKEILIDNGISPSRLTTVGMGSSMMIVSEDSREFDPWGNQYNMNMRVEIKILK